MLGFVVLLCAVFASAYSQSTAVSQCINHAGDLPINSYITGCETPPCILPQLEDCIINIIFRTPHTIHSMTTLATAYLFIGPIALPVPYDLQQNAVTCNFLTNTYCPLLPQEVVDYSLRMYIEPIFPVGTSATIEFRAMDQDNVPVFCLRVAVNIVAPRNSTGRNTLIVENMERHQIDMETL